MVKSKLILKDANQSYFKMNGQTFHIDPDATCKAMINISQTPMYVAESKKGYNYLQWLNFSGQQLSITVYSKINETYHGDKIYPPEQTEFKITTTEGVKDIYDDATQISCFSVLKFWAQNFVDVVVDTNIGSIDDGTYKIVEFSQTNTSFYIVKTELNLVQYKKTETDKYYDTKFENNPFTYPDTVDATNIVGTAREIYNLGQYKKLCDCLRESPPNLCTSTSYEDVKVIQKYLQRLGYFPLQVSNVLSGKYCYWTQEAVKNFQLDHQLSVTGDFDSSTRLALKKVLTG